LDPIALIPDCYNSLLFIVFYSFGIHVPFGEPLSFQHLLITE
ncbi:MAG: hypothetical protein ACJAZ2_002236, partial [Glaciecola sp.]